MDLVNLMYRYINKFINSDDLVKELENIDLSKYSKEETKEIEKLILDVKSIKDSTPNECDEVEKKRISQTDRLLELFENAIRNNEMDDETKAVADKHYNKLLKNKEYVRDGGKLYSDIFEVMTNNDLVNKYAKKMDDKELLDFITQYISAPFPPKINQEVFNELVNVGIEEDKREALWRLAFNYNYKNMDFSLIEDYYIEKRDYYYLVELISAVDDDLDMNKLLDKIKSTKDLDFINNFIDYAKKIDLITNEEIEKLIDEKND